MDYHPRPERLGPTFGAHFIMAIKPINYIGGNTTIDFIVLLGEQYVNNMFIHKNKKTDYDCNRLSL